MAHAEKGRRVVTAKLDADVHIALKILVKRYRNRIETGRVSLSDAARFFIDEHDPDLAKAAQRQADEQEDLAGDE